MSDEFVSVAQAAALLTLSPWTIRQWMTTGRLLRYHVGRRVVLRREDVMGMAKLETKSQQRDRNVEREKRKAKN
jgi:excisionase family DNA binding protein